MTGNLDMPASIPSSTRLLPDQYQVLFERIPVPILVVERVSYRILAANEAAIRCYGHASQRLLELNLEVLFDPEDWPHVQHELLSYPQAQLERKSWRQRSSLGGLLQVQIDIALLEFQSKSAYMLLLRDVSIECRRLSDQEQASAHMRAMLEGTGEGFFNLDKEARFTYVNRRAEKMLHKYSQDLLGRVIWDCFPEAVETDHYFHYTMALQGIVPSYYEVFYPPWQVWHEVRVYPSKQGISVHFRDVTQRHDELEHINQEREQFNAIVNVSNDAIISVNAQGMIQTFNPGAERIFQVRREEMLGRAVDTLLPERFRLAHAVSRSEFSHAKCPGGRMMGLRRVKGLRADGVEIDLEGSIANVMIDGQPVLISTLRDVTQILASEAQQQSMRLKLSQLTHRMMSQEKDLIRRVAMALHDQLGQTMAAIRIIHETIAAKRSQADAVEIPRLDNQLGALIDQAVNQVRVVLTDLQPPMLGEHGLAAALDNELRNRVRSQTTMQLVLQAPPELGRIRWPAAVEHAVFMIAREAVENAIRHSGGSRLNMTLAGSDSDLTLDIWDNGRGFPMDSEKTAGHLGLISIMERAKSIGAHVTTTSGAKGGAQLSLHWEATR